MGEWIEIINRRFLSIIRESHPSWVSGLKFFTLITSRNVTASHPSWVSGLKFHFLLSHVAKHNVSPFMGEWIER